MEEHFVQKPRRGAGKWILGVLIVLSALCAVAALLVFGVNRFYLTITMAGEPEMTLEYGGSYEEPGAEVRLHGTLFWQDGVIPEDVPLTVQSNVNPEVLGDYSVEYSTEFQWLDTTAHRTVRVVDTQAPEIKLVRKSNEPLIEGTAYQEEGFSAQDNYDGDITDRVQRQELYGKVVYTVADSSGNTSSVEREIPYYDPIPPTILLEGESEIRLNVGKPYQEPGFLGLDNVDGEITELVAVEGEVNCFVPGTYPITYTVSDTHENLTVVTRTVEVTRQPRVDVQSPRGKVIYLTFDDGPGPYTDELLYLLDYYGVKATFFVTDSGYDDMMKRIVKEGHAIGIHTRTHNYDEIYQNPESFFADLYSMQDTIYRNTGVTTTLMRFPGGGSNLVSKRFYPGLMTLLTEAVQDAGFQYFDWNVDSNDAGGATDAETVAANVIEGVQRERVSVVLQHDIHGYSVNAVEEIILWGLDNGYTFLPLQEDSPPCHHPVYN